MLRLVLASILALWPPFSTNSFAFFSSGRICRDSKKLLSSFMWASLPPSGSSAKPDIAACESAFDRGYLKQPHVCWTGRTYQGGAKNEPRGYWHWFSCSTIRILTTAREQPRSCKIAKEPRSRVELRYTCCTSHRINRRQPRVPSCRPHRR